jgi:hypothetical protein
MIRVARLRTRVIILFVALLAVVQFAHALAIAFSTHIVRIGGSDQQARLIALTTTNADQRVA